MPSLSDLVRDKTPTTGETNLEQGEMFSFYEGAEYTKFHTCWCWVSCGAGTVRLEIWGAGGSGAKMCCCGFGLPGNSGAYARRDFTVDSGCYICGCNGFACGNADALCFRGCSEPTNVCWYGSGTNGCMCAMGGKGGVSYCSTSNSAKCCYLGNGFCGLSLSGNHCALICNVCPGAHIACAYGGEINRNGLISCTSFRGCQAMCICCTVVHLAGPPGVISEEGTIVSYTMDSENAGARWSGMSIQGALAGVNGAGRSPSMGMDWRACWDGSTYCGCYQQNGCYPQVPYGWGGAPAQPCPGVRDSGYRGGHGNTRIRFIES